MTHEPFLIIDGHLDLAFNALNLRRDLTLPAADVRTADDEKVRSEFGTCMVTLPEMRRGRVAIALGTIMIRIDPAGSYAGSGMRVQTQCYGAGRGHAAYYEALERAGRGQDPPLGARPGRAPRALARRQGHAPPAGGHRARHGEL